MGGGAEDLMCLADLMTGFVGPIMLKRAHTCTRCAAMEARRLQAARRRERLRGNLDLLCLLLRRGCACVGRDRHLALLRHAGRRFTVRREYIPRAARGLPERTALAGPTAARRITAIFGFRASDSRAAGVVKDQRRRRAQDGAEISGRGA